MPKNNSPYALWQSASNLALAELRRNLTHFVEIATLAANSHNTQPWKFIIGENKIEILPDLARPLHYSDRTNREMYISLGCAAGNMLVGAAKCGWKAKIEYLPEDSWTNCAMRINFSAGKENPVLSALYPSIFNRVTNRFPYVNNPIEESLLAQMTDLVKDLSVKVVFLTDANVREKIGKLIFEVGKLIYSDKIFRNELSEWARGTDSDSPDGMPLFDMEMPSKISRIGPKLIKIMPATFLARREKRLLESSPALMIITHPVDDRESWLRTGVAFQLISLRATLAGVSFCPWAGFVEHPQGNKKFIQLLNVKDHVLMFARLGQPSKPMPHSPRRPIAQVLA